MFVLAQEGKTYARLRFNIGPGGDVMIPVCVDYSLAFGPSEQEAWEVEYQANIKASVWSRGLVYDDEVFGDAKDSSVTDYCLPQDIIEQLEEMEPAERQAVLDELSVRPELWSSEEEEVFYD